MNIQVQKQMIWYVWMYCTNEEDKAKHAFNSGYENIIELWGRDKPRPCVINMTIQSNFDEIMILLSSSTEKEMLSIWKKNR